MQVEVFPLGPLETNCYLAHANGLALAVDVGGDPSRVLSFLKNKNLRLTHILLTHLHFDHILGVKRLADALKPEILASEADRFLLDDEIGAGGFSGFPRVGEFEFSDPGPGERSVAGQKCLVLETPGHSPGSLSYYFPEAGQVFAGDLLFARSVGRTDLPGGDFDVLTRSVTQQIFPLPPGTLVHPGHGPSTTVGDEKKHNPFFSPHGGW